MAIFIKDCPHCLGKDMRFLLLSEYQHEDIPEVYTILGDCGGCQKPVIFRITWSIYAKSSPKNFKGFINDASYLHKLWMIPEPSPVIIPEHLPEIVAHHFKEAVEIRKKKHFDASALSYRKALELALKHVVSEPGKKSLYQRIEQLEQNRRLTPDMKAWAHEIRLSGNEAAHDDTKMTEEEVLQLHDFTETLLIYLFTLPERVRLRREKASQKYSSTQAQVFAP